MGSGERLQRRLVGELQASGFLRSERVADAFYAVPRHLFVPGHPLTDVYTNRAFITKQTDGVPVSSSSEPAIMAIMLEQLDLQPGQRVLEIGAGTGYNAALIAHAVGRRGRVTAVDIDPEVADGARRHLRSAGAPRVRVVTGDGGFGEPEGAPYDRIIATAGCWQIPGPWIEQLVEGGLLVLPLRLNGVQASFAFRKEGDALVSDRAAMCGFMPLRGTFGRLYARAWDGLWSAADAPLPARIWRALERLLQDSRRVRVAFPRGRDRLNSPLYYIALCGKPVLLVLRSSETGGEAPFALLTSTRSAIALPWTRPPRRGLTLFGNDEALEYLNEALAAWRDEGRPDLRELRAIVRPATKAGEGALPRPASGRYRFHRGEHRYELWFER